MIEWNNIKSSIDDLLNLSSSDDSSDSDYLTVLFKNLEKKRYEYESVPFKIVDIREQGFKIRVGGLFGYISFYHMPWKYSGVESWRVIYPHIQEKIFFAKIFELHKNEKSIAVKLNGEIAQFKTPDLIIDKKYNGIITKKTNYGIFIDLGYHFEWSCGSIQGLIHKSQFENIEYFENLSEGQIIEVFYWGTNEKEQIILGLDVNLKDWLTGGIRELIGDIVNVKVMITNTESKEFTVENMYKGLMPVTKAVYPNMNRTHIKIAISNLKNEEIIQCEIIGINEKRKALLLKWISNQEIENVISRTLPENVTIKKTKLYPNSQNNIENRAKPEIVKKLKLIGEIVNVEVLKNGTNSQNKYLIEGKYKGKLSITNDNYRISVTEKQNIERNLQDGDILSCEILSIEKKSIKIKWRIDDEELSRFINFND